MQLKFSAIRQRLSRKKVVSAVATTANRFIGFDTSTRGRASVLTAAVDIHLYENCSSSRLG
jgi:hypothetical protein